MLFRSVFVYIAAPLLDNRIRVIRKQVLVWSCLILLGMYAADTVYSAGHPNEGDGITDYEVQSRFPDLHESAVWVDQQGHYGTQEGYICWQ